MKKFKFEGFTYDNDVSSEVGSDYYNRDENGDDSIQIIQDSEEDERTIAIFYKDCAMCFVTSFIGPEENSVIEEFLNSRIKKYFTD